LMVAVNAPLFEWVIENLCKNAVDAMEGVGNISVVMSRGVQGVHIEISDTGKGIARKHFKGVFRPGFT
ncbi:ATP-binding protein, partial [Acinetobacter sp. 163]|nr:ATP-binding protein [Acinetobacter sp. 163]